MQLSGKHILLGVSGGIAAYKAPMLVRQLRQEGADVQVVLTAAAREFVSPLALTAVAGKPPREELFDPRAEAAMGHIELARWADLVLIAPATANCLARLAHGFADDLLTTLVLATEAPVLVAPAMNRVMWASGAVQDNVTTLQRHGRIIIGPDSGEQACGETGPGRMCEPPALVQAVLAQLQPARPLAGVNILITAGPTREAIDPVRYISNHSSGKQGYAVAEMAARLGARVTLVSGPTALACPPGVERVNVVSAREMLDAVLASLPETRIFIGVAAVADYRPDHAHERKIKRHQAGINAIALAENPDIIATVAKHASRPPLVVGFAAETHDALDHAREKRVRKGLDAIVVNDVSDTTIGFNSDDNAATLIAADGETAFPAQAKTALALALMQSIAELYAARNAAGS
ncbi:MAG: bifunctional phosphopantothenoylcysteine decarboxylase/phosphopantothenate--cysteine ligase CoaBC [Pseudomonadales bacterium]|nr:bifunctional phosphopantothenoylcysteine decarboxylase/phosphopantothenate--cysteine ligase CoaBC [Pseudomonadales bacterium]MCP5183441.1 bifunctional phosphopantothenoylcysteine decarboxylase/phosphopantothenate--cysteine ligase CoaBC [Pseudomonadales bacterium]